MARPDKLPKILTVEKTDRLLAQPNQRYFGPHRDYLFRRLMLKAGLRSDGPTSRAHRSHKRKAHRSGGQGRERPHPLVGEEVLGELQEWMDRLSEEVDTESPSYLLPTRKGTEVAPSHLRRLVKRYADKADIEEVSRVSPHTLRHTFATRLYRETGNIRMVQKALGHSDLSTTMIYTHVVDEEMEGAMKGL